MYFISAHMSNSSIHIIKKVLILRSFHTFQIKSIHEQAVQEIIFFPLPWKFVASVGSPFHRLLGSMGRLIPMELFVYVLLLVCTGLALCCLCTPELHDGACVPNYQWVLWNVYIHVAVGVLVFLSLRHRAFLLGEVMKNIIVRLSPCFCSWVSCLRELN